MEAGRNGNNQWEWEGNGNKARLNMRLGMRLGMGMGMNHQEREGFNGIEKDIPAQLYPISLAASAAWDRARAGSSYVPLPACDGSADELHRVADILYSRRRLSLRSSSTSTLVVPPMRHSTIGDHSFPVAASG